MGKITNNETDMSVKINGKPLTIEGRPVKVRSFNIKPCDAFELRELLESILDRTEKTPLYVFTEEELDSLGGAVDFLIDQPVYEFIKEVSNA